MRETLYSENAVGFNRKTCAIGAVINKNFFIALGLLFCFSSNSFLFPNFETFREVAALKFTSLSTE